MNFCIDFNEIAIDLSFQLIKEYTLYYIKFILLLL
jgi:hypothetical protein